MLTQYDSTRQNINYLNKYDSSRSPLHSAAEQGDLSELRKLLQKGWDPNLANCYGVTPLHLAANYGYEDISLELLKFGANPNFQDYKLQTPLHHAAYQNRCYFRKVCNHFITVQYLLMAGGDPNLQDKNQQTFFTLNIQGTLGYNIHEDPIYINYHLGKAPIKIHALIKEVNTYRQIVTHSSKRIPRQDVPVKPRPIITCFSKTCVDALLNEDPTSALFHATVNNNVIRVRELLDNNANPNLLFFNNSTSAIHYAALKGYLPILSLLLEKGGKPNLCDYDNRTPLHKAVRNGKSDTILALLKEGADPNFQDHELITPMHFTLAEYTGTPKTEVLKNLGYLILAGGNPNLPDIRGRTFISINNQEEYPLKVDDVIEKSTTLHKLICSSLMLSQNVNNNFKEKIEETEICDRITKVQLKY